MIFLYQMGRVGSRSIFYHITRKTRVPIYHIHTFEPHKTIDGLPVTGNTPEVETKLRKISWDIINSPKTKILIPIREPLTRCLSSFFHPWHNVFYKTRYEKNLEALKNKFVNTFNHDWTLNWFDNEVKKYLDIDVYKYNFNYKDGFVRIQEKDKDIIIFYSCNISGNLSEIIRENWGFRIGKISRKDNLASGRYNEFKNKIRFESSFVDKYYNSKYSKHFYGYQIEDLIKRWCK